MGILMPLTTTQVIPTGWAAHHQPVATGAMTATCTITPPTETSGWSPTTGPTTATAATAVYTGVCRVQAQAARGGEVDAAGQAVTRRPYLVAITAGAAAIAVGSRVAITACAGDARLVGKHLTVVDVVHASERFERDLTCTLDLTNQG